MQVPSRSNYDVSVAEADQELDLAKLVAASRPDPYLQAIAGLSSAGSTYVLGLLVGGMTVYGRTSTARPLAEALDAEHDRFVIRARKASDEPDRWNEASARVAGIWTQGFEEDEAEHQELVERLSDRAVDELTPEEQRELVEDRPQILTLVDARVFPPGASRHLEVEVLRVPLASIGGWWLIPTNEDGKAAFAHPVA